MQNEITMRNKQVKQALLRVYDAKNVSVTGDRGTAYGWVRVKVTLDRPDGCKCNIVEQVATWAKVPYTYKYRGQLSPDVYSRSTYYCQKCLEIVRDNKEKIDKIVYGCGAKFSHYYADDGYNTQRSEVCTEVEVRT